MKTSLMILAFIVSSCKGNFRGEAVLMLTDNDAKCWYIDFERNNTHTKRLTLWYFSVKGDYFDYYYDNKTKKMDIKDYGDNIPINKFILTSKDTIVFYGKKFPIVKLSNDELILEDLYGSYPSFGDGNIYLKSCSSNNELFNLNYKQLLEKMEGLIAEYYTKYPDLKELPVHLPQ